MPSSVIRVFSSPLAGTGEGRRGTATKKDSVLPLSRHEEGKKLFLCLHFSVCLRLNTVLPPTWHVLEWHPLSPCVILFNCLLQMRQPSIRGSTHGSLRQSWAWSLDVPFSLAGWLYSVWFHTPVHRDCSLFPLVTYPQAPQRASELLPWASDKNDNTYQRGRVRRWNLNEMCVMYLAQLCMNQDALLNLSKPVHPIYKKKKKEKR